MMSMTVQWPIPSCSTNTAQVERIFFIFFFSPPTFYKSLQIPSFALSLPWSAADQTRDFSQLQPISGKEDDIELETNCIVRSSEDARMRFLFLMTEAVGVAAPLISPFASCELSAALPLA